ncbi:MAG: HAD hydrolase family protein, partial [Lachnospiraceae bacterium]|nr:HAD hydrolase family protein [Lachnospiraceae bacterium]
MSKLLFFDIDGTLAMPGRTVSRRTRDAIRAARANGHKAF